MIFDNNDNFMRFIHMIKTFCYNSFTALEGWGGGSYGNGTVNSSSNLACKRHLMAVVKRAVFCHKCSEPICYWENYQ